MLLLEINSSFLNIRDIVTCAPLFIFLMKNYYLIHHLLIMLYFGSVWIQFIFAEIENWNGKHCNEIIFKCVNSIVGPIFSEKVVEKWNLWDPWTVHPCIVHGWFGQTVRQEQKRKKRRRENARQNVDVRFNPIQTLSLFSVPNVYIMFRTVLACIDGVVVSQ